MVLNQHSHRSSCARHKHSAGREAAFGHARNHYSEYLDAQLLQQRFCSPSSGELSRSAVPCQHLTLSFSVASIGELWQNLRPRVHISPSAFLPVSRAPHVLNPRVLANLSESRKRGRRKAPGVRQLTLPHQSRTLMKNNRQRSICCFMKEAPSQCSTYFRHVHGGG